MPLVKKYDDEIRVKVTSEFKKKLIAVSDRRGINYADFVRRMLEVAIDEDNAKEGIDAIASTLRKVVRDQNKTFEDRFAAMIYKDTVASATSMNLLLLLIEQMGHDALAMYEQSSVKAAAYANQPLRDKK